MTDGVLLDKIFSLKTDILIIDEIHEKNVNMNIILSQLKYY